MPTIKDIRAKMPELDGLDDSHAIEYIQSVHYPSRSKEEIAQRLGVGIEKSAPDVPSRNAFGVANDYDAPPTAEQPSSNLRRAADYLPTLVKSAIAVPEFAVGMADLVSGGRVGKFLENEGGAVGFRPKEARAALDEFYSPEQKAAFQEVQNANGFIGTGMAALRNPSVIGQSVVESLGLMGAGGVVARGLGAAAPGVSAAMRGAIGEGVVGAGSAAEQIRQETADGLLTGKQAALSAASGLADTAFGALGGKIAQRLGIADVDTMLAGKGNPSATKGFVRSVLEGAASEGLLEELPQSISEQVLQNVALGKPVSEGVDQAAVLGLLSGGFMGGGANAVNSMFPAAHPADEIRNTKMPATGPLTKGLNAAVETHAEAVETAVADAATQTRRQQTAPIVEQLRQLPPEQQDEALQMMAVADNMQAPGPVRRRAQNRLDFLLSQIAPPADAAVDPATGEIAPVAVEPPLSATPEPMAPIEVQAATETADAAAADADAAVAQREADRPEPVLTPRQDGDILTSSGNPFKNMTAAMRALSRAGDGFELARVDGGLVVRKTAASDAESASPVNDGSSTLDLTTQPQPISGAAARSGAADVQPRPEIGQPDATALQSSHDGAALGAQLLRDSVTTEAFRKKGLGGLDVPTRRAVLAHVVDALQDLKIRQRVVQSIPVNMVHILAGKQGAAEVLLHDPAMLKNVLAFAEKSTVSSWRDAADALVRGVAQATAESSGATLFGSDPLKDDAAVVASKIDGKQVNTPTSIDEPGPSLVAPDDGPPTVSNNSIPGAQKDAEIASALAERAPTVTQADGATAAQAEQQNSDPSATTAQPTGTLQEQWQDAVKRGDTEAAAKINDQIVAEKKASKATEPADDTNPTSGTRAEAQAPADQAPTPAGSDATAPASVPAAGSTDVEARGVADHASPSSPARPKKRGVPAAKAAAAREAKLADYFTPGNVVHGYGGQMDRVISYTPGTDEKMWSVKVQHVVKQGDNYVVAKERGREVEERQHSTEPSEKELKAGPVARAPAKESAPETQARKSGQGKTEAPPDLARTEETIVAAPADERFDAGKALTKEQRKQVLGTLVDVYKEKNAPREQKGVDSNGNERFGYAHSPELFEKSDITGAMVRYHVTLPDGRRAHPSELFPDYTQSQIDAALADQAAASKAETDAAENRRKVLSTRIATTLAEANTIFNKQNPGARDFVPAILTDGSSFVRVAPETAEADARLLGEGWKVQAHATSEKPPVKDRESARIDDFGEKLDGARKDYAATLKDAESVDVAAEPLSKSWPEPDYQKLLDGGADPFVVAFIHAARDEVPTKPQKGWKLKGWVTSVQALRTAAAKLMDGSVSKAKVQDLLESGSFDAVRRNVGSRAELYELVGHQHSLKGVTFAEHHYTLYRGEQNVTKWVVEQKAKATLFSNWPRELAVADTKAEMLAQFKDKIGSLDLGKKAKGQSSQFVIYRKRGQTGAWIGKKIGREYIDLHQAEDVTKARAYMAEHASDLEAKLAKYRDTPYERRDENQPRVGDDHRNGAPVTPDVFMQTFGFRGVQFGNYVEQDRRQSDLNEAFDGLMDLAAVLGVPPRALSLNGTLGLAFGARGKGGKRAPAAHFEPGNIVINLTKGGGPGSLAHEWWHGLDNYFARQAGGTSGLITGGAPMDRLRPQLQGAYKSVRIATQAPTLRKRAAELDKRRSKPYWNTPEELSARAFESYVIAKLQDQGAANDYLANVVDEKVWNLNESARSALFGEDSVESYPYPGQAELPAVRAAFDDFFKTVETRTEDDGNVAMFSRTASYKVVVDSVLDGTTPESASVQVSDSLPVLEALGLPSLPVATTGDRLAKMHYDHGLTRSDLKALPELLANPVMVFDSATKPGSKVLVLDLWRRGSPVIAAIHPNVQLKRVDVNLLASAYPKDRPEQLGAWFREKLLRYADKDKTRAWATNGGVQFPWLVQLQRGSGSSVIGPGDVGKPALSRTEPVDSRSAARRLEDVTQLAEQITSRWANAPEVVVVEDMSDPRVPGSIRAEDARQQSQGATGAPEGIYYKGKVYLVASELRGDADVVRVLFHEALGHAGLRGTFGKELGAILDRLAVLNQGKVRNKAKQYGLNYEKPSDRRAAAEEVLAEMAQTRPEIGWVKRAIAAIRTFLRDHVPGFSRMQMTDDEIVRNFILPARRFVEQGGETASASMSEAGISDAMASRSPAEMLRGINQESIRNAFLDATTSHDNVNLWAKTVGTQYDKAQRNPQTFGRVFNAVQDYIKDISSFANAAADQAPSILPKLETWKDLKPNSMRKESEQTASKKDLDAVGAVIFQGTLDKQLLDRPALLAKGLTEKQADLYEEFRAAVNQSLEDVAKTELVRLAGDAGAMVAGRALAQPTAREAADILADHLRQQGLTEDADGLYGKVETVEKLKAEGYAPLMRFGRHTVHIQLDGETLFFGMYESRTEANAMARQLRGDPEFAGLPVEQGVMSQESYKLFNGLSIDSLELFANEVGGQDNPVYQDFLKLTKNNRSALKRLIHRNGTAGFSTNTERVLASFVTSNARLASGNLHLGRAKAAANDIPKEMGDLKDEAVKLVEWVQNPTETAQALRGLLFTTFIGGSVASALVNMTQPMTMTLPYLSQYGGLAKAGSRMLAALKIVASGKATGELGQALRRAEADGIVSPQEIHHLQAATTDSLGNNPYLKTAAFIWGSMFSLAEQFNRRLSFVAAYQTALDNKMTDPFAFAEKAVVETQGLYNKGNGANWTRNVAGATALTFKQFSTHYIEWITRMYQSGPEGKKAAITALAILMLAGGAGGLPFADDLDDLIDTLAQALGYDFNSKRAKRKFIADALEPVLGKNGSEVAAEIGTRGLTAMPGFPMDLSLRMGMGNLLPATGILLRSNTDTGRQVLEVAGAAGSLANMALEGGKKMLQGEPVGAVKEVVPVAIQNVAKALEMWNTGEYRNQKGAKVMDVDAVDGAMKFVGFQPAEVARESAEVNAIQRTIQLAKNVESDLGGRMAQARVDGDLEAEQAAREELIAWNRKNPETPIRIRPQDIVRRVRELKSSRADRLVKSAPKELRGAVREAVN